MAIPVDQFQGKQNSGGVMSTPAFRIGLGALTGGAAGAAIAALPQSPGTGVLSAMQRRSSQTQDDGQNPSPIKRRLNRAYQSQVNDDGS